MDAATWGALAGVVSLPVAVVSVVLTALARRDARRSADEAANMTAIERRRDHVALTPDLVVRVVPEPGRAFGSARLALTLAGPAGLDRLDRVVLRVLDDHPRVPIVAGGPGQADLDEVIWAPWRFAPHADGADSEGRTVTLVTVRPGRDHMIGMRLTVPPPWQEEEPWREDQAGQPIRLEVLCERGDASWMVAQQIPQPQPELVVTLRTRNSGAWIVEITNQGTASATEVNLTPEDAGAGLHLDAAPVGRLEPGQTMRARADRSFGSREPALMLRYRDFTGIECVSRIDLTHA